MGKYISPWMVEVEEKFGKDALIEFLDENACRTIYLPRNPTGTNLAERTIIAFLAAQRPGEYLSVPLGPISHSNRISWTVLQLIMSGHGRSYICNRLKISERAFHKAKISLAERGALSTFEPKEQQCS